MAIFEDWWIDDPLYPKRETYQFLEASAKPGFQSEEILEKSKSQSIRFLQTRQKDE